MRPRVPVFHPGTRTPALPERQGVALVGPPGDAFHERGPQWLHGVLVVDAEPDAAARERWARSLFVTSIWAEASVPNVSNLVGDHHLLGQPVREQGGRWVLPFQLDLSEHLGVDRRPGLHHVQVCARTLRSPVLALTCRPGAPDDVARALFGDAAPQGPVDALLLGSALLRQGRAGAALPHFEAALADEALRGDLDRGVLYQAACAAARASAEATEEDAHQALVERALEWLEEDLARRRRVLQERLVLDFYADVAGQLPAARRDEFERLRHALVAHFRQARDEDPDLRVLRERAVDDLFHLLPEPVAAPTPEAVAAALAPAPAPVPAAPAHAHASLAAVAPAPVPSPAPEAPAPAPAAEPAPAPAAPPEAASTPAPAAARTPEEAALRRERMSTARRRAAEIRARVRARLDDLEKKIPPAGA